MIAIGGTLTIPRIYPILDLASLGQRGLAVEAAAEALLEGGAAILQFRHKGRFSRVIFEQAERVAQLCARAHVLFIMNDRADMALLLGAGLHVGQDDLPPSEARRLLGEGRTIGFSTHNAEQLGAAAGEPVDYLAFGPVFATRSKEKPDPAVGMEGLRRIRSFVAGPLVAIGGITRGNAREVLAAGADSLAVIHDMLPEHCTYATVRARMEEWQQLVKT